MINTAVKRFLALIVFMPMSVAHAATGQTSIMDERVYRSVCAQAAQDPAAFASFRAHPVYQYGLEHVTYDQGLECLRIIQQRSAQFLTAFDRFKTSDLVGSPVCYEYETLGKIAPTTMRYIKIASDLQTLFGSLDGLSIIEIGGGYGGQCKILADLFNFKSYTIVDLPEPLALTKKFLSHCKVKNVRLVSPDEYIPGQQYDLVISNYAFSECCRDVQQKYIDEILVYAHAGYLTCNVLPQESIKISYQHELLQVLTRAHISYFLLPEEPLTNWNNYVVVWTHNKNTDVDQEKKE